MVKTTPFFSPTSEELTCPRINIPLTPKTLQAKKIHLSKNIPQGVFLLLFLFFKGKHIWKVMLSKV